MKPKRIAVFDFDPRECELTAKAVADCCEGEGIAAEVKKFTMIQTFAYDYKDNDYDAVFMGISSMMGVEMARLLRSGGRYSPMFIVSASEEYGLEGYRLHVLDYLIKPVTPERVKSALARIGSQALRGMESACAQL